MSAARDVARAIDAFRRGWPVAIDDLVCLAVETADDKGLGALDAEGPADLLISPRRAETLRLTNRIEAAFAGPVRVGRDNRTNLVQSLAIADPALDLATPLKGPFDVRPPYEGPGAAAALRLARLAGLLPAVFAAAAGAAEAAASAAAIEAFAHARDVRIVSRAGLPTGIAEKAEIVAFRIEGDTGEAVALLLGEPRGEPPLVRIHSECLTGDVLGSLKCDCGSQLRDALAAIAASGWGILLYLRQEGRGIGLVNKLRAYALQDQGFDTVDANHRLGFEDDERDFGVGAHMLLALAQREVRLLSNNPRKAAGLAEHGIQVAAVVPLQVQAGAHNREYLAAKRDRSGHQL